MKNGFQQQPTVSNGESFSLTASAQCQCRFSEEQELLVTERRSVCRVCCELKCLDEEARIRLMVSLVFLPGSNRCTTFPRCMVQGAHLQKLQG